MQHTEQGAIAESNFKINAKKVVMCYAVENNVVKKTASGLL